MRVFVCDDHEGFFPVGVCSVIVADTEARAAELLRAKLIEHGLTKNQNFTLRELNVSEHRAFIINDGDY